MTRIATFKMQWDLSVLAMILIGGFIFYMNIPYWAGTTYIGGSQYGDAAFWWNGALHITEGIIHDNPNLTFRMGYALVAGVFSAALNSDFSLFHILLISTYFFLLFALYPLLKMVVGNVAALGSIALAIFNPFVAEWLAISTSDSLGLVMNLGGIICLLYGVYNRSNFILISASGLLFGLAFFTRPLMGPYIVVTCFIIAFSGDARERLIKASFILLTAYLVPLLIWMFSLHAVIGGWEIAGHDSSAFYAASDPKIQVWNPSMYAAVETAAVKKYGVKNPSTDQLNKEFWTLTLRNYVSHLAYHLERIPGHVYSIAAFSDKDMAKDEGRWKLLRKGIILVVVLSLIFSVLKRSILTAIVLGMLGLLAVFSPIVQASLVLSGALLFLFYGLFSLKGRLFLVLSSYWWIGVVALYLTGGTWGSSPFGIELNALGYRLGSQFFFINDFILVGFLCFIANKGSYICQYVRNSYVGSRKKSSVVPTDIEGFSSLAFELVLIRRLSYLFLSVLAILFVVGIFKIGYRVWESTYSTAIRYPDFKVKSLPWWQNTILKVNPAAQLKIAMNLSGLNRELSNAIEKNKTSPYVIFTGQMSDFIWNFQKQDRSQSIIYIQRKIIPITMSPNLAYFQFSRHLDKSYWHFRQGLWIVRKFPDITPISNLPYYFSETSVKAFIPLAIDKKNYDFPSATVFPLDRYASQLFSSGYLTLNYVTLEWSPTSGTEKYPRRFLLKKTMSSNQDATILLDISPALGHRKLKFGWAVEKSISQKKSIKLIVSIKSTMPGSKAEQIFTQEYSEDVNGILKAELDLSKVNAKMIEVKFENIKNGNGVWLYEFNLQADDFRS